MCCSIYGVWCTKIVVLWYGAVWSVLSSCPRLLITVYVASHRYATIDIP